MKYSREFEGRLCYQKPFSNLRASSLQGHKSPRSGAAHLWFTFKTASLHSAMKNEHPSIAGIPAHMSRTLFIIYRTSVGFNGDGSPKVEKGRGEFLADWVFYIRTFSAEVLLWFDSWSNTSNIRFCFSKWLISEIVKSMGIHFILHW